VTSLRAIILDFDQWFIVTFVIVMIICFIWFFCALCLQWDWLGAYFQNPNWSFTFAFLLSPLGRTLYMPILNVLLLTFSCTYDISEGNITFNADPSLFCWRNGHLAYVVFAIIGILLYYPFAVRLNPVWQQLPRLLDIHYKSSYLILAAQVKFILVAASVFFRTYTLIYLIVCYFCVISLLVLQIGMKPCNILKINIIRIILLSITLWTVICVTVSYVLSTEPSNNNNVYLEVMLYGGWLVIVIIGFVLYKGILSGRLQTLMSHRSAKIKELAVFNNSNSQSKTNKPWHSTNEYNSGTSYYAKFNQNVSQF